MSHEEEAENQRLVDTAGAFLKAKRTSDKTLVMGTGEFMYLPMLLADHMGDGVLYQSCTRSPIHPSEDPAYGAKSKFAFKSYYDSTLSKYFYNVDPESYDEIFIMFEKRYSDQDMLSFQSALLQTGIKRISYVWC